MIVILLSVCDYDSTAGFNITPNNVSLEIGGSNAVFKCQAAGDFPIVWKLNQTYLNDPDLNLNVDFEITSAPNSAGKTVSYLTIKTDRVGWMVVTCESRCGSADSYFYVYDKKGTLIFRVERASGGTVLSLAAGDDLSYGGKVKASIAVVTVMSGIAIAQFLTVSYH